MTNEEAINLLDNLKGMIDDSQGNNYDSAFNLAIKALEKQAPMEIRERERQSYNQALNDLQKMIDNEYLDGDYGDYHEIEKIARMIEQLKR